MAQDGTVIVNGCSPKLKIKGIYLGVPEAVLNFDSKVKKSPVSALVEELVSAHKRGVKIKVILDQSKASCLAKPKELAKEFLADFSEIAIDYEASVLDEERVPAVRLSDSFLWYREEKGVAKGCKVFRGVI